MYKAFDLRNIENVKLLMTFEKFVPDSRVYVAHTKYICV
jgi:hypothetical protein